MLLHKWKYVSSQKSWCTEAVRRAGTVTGNTGDKSMVKVDPKTTDQIVAWRVRDTLAAHPLLGGATAQIHIIAGYEAVILVGWAVDESVLQLAVHLTQRIAGKRTVQPELEICRHAANKALTKRIFDDNRSHALS